MIQNGKMRQIVKDRKTLTESEEDFTMRLRLGNWKLIQWKIEQDAKLQMSGEP